MHQAELQQDIERSLATTGFSHGTTGASRNTLTLVRELRPSRGGVT